MAIPHDDTVLSAFHYAATHLPFYTLFLQRHGLVPHEVRTITDFIERVPLLTKEDVFTTHAIDDLSCDGVVPEYISAIVSSGTSGTFSYGLLTKKDVEMQGHMLDTLLDELFNAKAHPPLIVNALPMGVSFSSRYPIIPTSVRTDIARKVITTLGKGRQVIIITDPQVLKKMLEEGIDAGTCWSEYMLSAVVGGAGSSDSCMTYMRECISGNTIDPSAQNQILQTMGITEVALNIFGGTPDLVHLRHCIEGNDELRTLITRGASRATPELMYHMARSVHLEIVNTDAYGVGDIVLTHLDTTTPTPLIRYRTGDKGCIVPHELLATIVPGLPVLPFPIVALYGREKEYRHAPVTPLEVEEVLYRDPEYMKKITGHFVITEENGTPTILIHMKKGVTNIGEKNIYGVPCRGVLYHEFPQNIDLNYEQKWSHIS